MIHKIKTSKASKVIASYMAIQLIVTTIHPSNLYALTSGPSQPEFTAFTPIGTSDMVNLSTGDFNYNIPIMDVGGYPLNLAYDAGITMDQEASWVGLGWNLNVGQINRQVRGIPDDFKGDEMTYEKRLEDHVTVGINADLDDQFFGIETDQATGVQTSNGGISLGMGVKYSNYEGVSITPSYGLSFGLSDNITVGMNVQTSATDGVTIAPRLSASGNLGKIQGLAIGGGLNAGVSYNSNRGLSSFSLGSSLSTTYKTGGKVKVGKENKDIEGRANASGSGTLSFSAPTYTPRKRNAFINTNGTLSFSFGADLWGIDGEVELTATGSIQKIKDPTKTEKAYGYEFTGQASSNDILDYNRENDRIITKNISILPTTVYSYDLYTVNGQGIAGMFRPHRSQIGQIYDELVKDESLGVSLGAEAEGGTGWHVGANLTVASSKSHTGVWQTNASAVFSNENENLSNGNDIDYEPVYFKYVGENKVDQSTLFTEQLYGDAPMALQVKGLKNDFGNYVDNSFLVKSYSNGSSKPIYTPKAIATSKLKRDARDLRNQAIQKFTKAELRALYNDTYYNKRANMHAEDHHTAEIRILKPDGATYVFGETAYNTTKHEVTFTTEAPGDCQTGIVGYNPGENKLNNPYNERVGIDNFYDRVITPEYAHSYLLSAVLSADYEDLTGDGPTDDDLGAYTLFEYEKAQEEDYKWRIPFGANEASYNAGLNSDNTDQKASYIYGEKEVKYIHKISTKTHVAIFDLRDRKDGYGVAGDDGGAGTGKLQHIHQIRLYSKPEFLKHEDALLLDDDITNDPVAPIKTAHFEYNYSLCPGVPNGDPIEGGKLTLDRVYFSYRSSFMGKHTPYVFNYGNNKPYNLKGHDIWGNYKDNTGSCDPSDMLTNAEFPFVDQEDETTQDSNAAAWSLSAIQLPSGGTINIEYESDDYQYVQDKPTMQMFKVVGCGNLSTSTDPATNKILYNINGDPSEAGEATHLYIQLSDETETLTPDAFKAKYLKQQDKKPIYFRFMLNMLRRGADNNSIVGQEYDYVTGYFDIEGDVETFQAISDGLIYAAIPMKTVKLEGGTYGNQDVNPISKAGWYFGRTYLNGVVNYGKPQDYRTQNIKSIAERLFEDIGAATEIFKGPNGKLRKKLCARQFIPEKSWIRLSTPKRYKLGGGLRVKQITMLDNWSTMNTSGTTQDYGQTYDYTLEDGSSSGVATFEPNDSAENPFVEPIYDNYEHLVAPREVSYVEKPFGKAFFPFSKVTYSRVTVKNLDRPNISRHATGKVVSEFYTSKDFPTKVDYTALDESRNYHSNERAVLKNMLKGLLGLKVHVKHEFTLSQGFSIHTNDMDGKAKSQKVYQEGDDKPISRVDYIYSTNPNNSSELYNKLPIINKNGNVSEEEIGVDYDVITDFRESYSSSKIRGLNVNVVTFLIGIFPVIVPSAFPSNSEHENIAHSAITTKTVHTTAILKEKIATDLGSSVSTVNEAWDAESGEIILTKTVNEFDDQYYNFNFPAYWAYNNMAQATKNLGMEGVLQHNGNTFTLTNANELLTPGDEILAYYGNDQHPHLWVVAVSDNNVTLMDRAGSIVILQEDINFKVVRSGYRNQQMANMASITMMESPLKLDPADPNPNEVDYLPIDHNTFLLNGTTTLADNPRIINASAVAYDEFWNAQCENGLKGVPYALGTETLAYQDITDYTFNPYVWNVKGLWRAEKSYAYLTEREDIKESVTTKANTRKEGYFKQFSPYYAYNGTTGAWEPNTAAQNEWTFASEVTQYSPYGAEIENKDALDRYSAAQYGYNFTLPTAVASNSRYRYMGADNFEDYHYGSTTNGHFNYKSWADVDGDNGVEISTDYAHTGNTSLLVPKQSGLARMQVELIGDIAPITDYDGDGLDDDQDKCPYIFDPNQPDYDEDYIGDGCDDESIPAITGLVIAQQVNCRDAQAKYIIQGTPNTTIHYAIIEQSSNPNGWNAYVNGTLIPRDKNNKQQNFTIDLDALGRANIQLHLVSKKRNRDGLFKKANNDPAGIDFQLLHKKTMKPIYGQKIHLEAKGWRKCSDKEFVTEIFPKPY